ncbi:MULTISPECIES: patatin-like phospholipase family protein [Alteribacter]|uniref:Patatin family protein n=1 Tax=Alteribacter keqinensis TaxID=2483800 RepID=A0A3M7TVX9_9BACI|nr:MULTISPECIES: patatin-like phospholipase family protein [Alteribacter]MBM7095885.1 patatin-like phospholipase family protein [Alteribacter salitolerans]RNA69706.1 patatin family protein [Alteribacter keqinensis]
MNPKIGLALGSGGSRGFAHIGVLKVLMREGIQVDYIAGSSMGALVGALFGAGHTPETMEKMAMQFRRKYFLDFTVPKMGFIKGEKAKSIIKMLVKQKKIEELSPEMAIVATDLKKGEKVVFKDGDVTQAVRASIAIPGILVPERIGGRLFVDGGVIDRVPVSVVKSMGADMVIAVDVSYFNTEPEITSIYDVIIQSMDIMEKEMVRYREIESDLMIRPIFRHIKATQFTDVEEIILQGEKEMEKNLDVFKERIAAWKEKHHERDEREND